MSRIPSQPSPRFDDLLAGLIGCRKDIVILTAMIYYTEKIQSKISKGGKKQKNKKMKGVDFGRNHAQTSKVPFWWGHTGWV